MKRRAVGPPPPKKKQKQKPLSSEKLWGEGHVTHADMVKCLNQI